jgi:tetratricopeptide (TPR) repeat protein
MNQYKRIFFLAMVLGLCSTSVSAQSVRSLLRKAKQQYDVRAYTKAIETYQQVLDRRKDNTEALGYLGDCYRHLNQMEEAADKYALAIQDLKAVEDKHILNFGKTLKALERYAQAEQVFKIYANRNPTLGNHYAASCEFSRIQEGMQTDFTVTNEKINSTATDFGPAFFLDEIVFASGRTDVQRSTYNWDGQAKNQLFVSRLGLDGFLQPPRYLKGTASTRGEGPASFSPEGNLIAFTNNDFISGIRQIPSDGNELVLYIAELGPTGAWFNERPFPQNDPNSKTGYPAFTPDGSAMFFASDREGGYGGYDLYISYKDNNIWSIPINLGPVVNTAGDEIAPFFDGTDLYFASDYHFGFGGFDNFKAEQRNGQWSVVSNLGVPINSSRDDYGYIYDGFKNIGYLTSNRPGGRGAEDIYKVSKSANSSVVLRVINAADGSPISFANLDFGTCGQSIAGGNTLAVTDARGVYSFPVPYDINCEVLVSSPGYVTNQYPLRTAALMGGGDLEIVLNREGEEFFGRVVSYRTQQALEGISITARNLNTGSSTQVFSDRAGTFKMGLQANTPYMITYSSPGYREIRRNINTTTLGTDGLGAISLSTTTELPPDNNNPDNGPVSPPPPNNGGMTQSGFAIQLGALGKRPDLGRYNNLNSINAGDVYVKAEGSVYKIRYGVFTDRSEAQRYVSAVRSRGYKDAFVVPENGVTIGGTTNPPVAQPPVNTSGSYKIQLAALRNTRFFDPSGVMSLGTIQDYRRGDLTIKVLGNFNSVQAAQNALTQVKRNGFPTAFIVVDQNGSLQRL